MPHYFYNDTPLDEVYFRQFGLSIKEDGAIGQFGTGLKYAIATILRGGGTIFIRSGLTSYTFSTRIISVRGREVQVVTMNGDDLAFNISLGKNWKPWMAFRELICNAWDEQGGYTTDGDYIQAHTVIEVQWNQFDSLPLNDYFLLRDDKPTIIFEGESLQVVEDHPGRVFYKGILVSHRPSSPIGIRLKGERWMTLLTEDRTMSSNFHFISRMAEELNDQSSDKIIEVWQKLDGTMEVQHLYTPPERVMERFSNLVYNRRLRSDTARAVVENWERRKPPVIREPSREEWIVLDRCLEMMKAGGIPINAPIRVMEQKHRAILGKTNMEEICINEATFSRGLREVLKTLLEEQCHIEYGVEDQTYAIQDALQDMWVRTFCHLTKEIL